ncbi:hypothetical protein Cob_v001822 [Colletotrichum orbiculare MAFF 240422]|uniref:Uncharacterized protein n=1 Tax=Colletotrichum orbiculare (strain 104-T / ATCC 96160 / CBS 514.97 / LARS 414 / MAFF 240422) TaxID=1213857 RepID=A0A484G600_COLOR|nr:hypothetical protein Cob_v001822 [Colletotrichum orbiculare MAFF 240422]
MNGCKERAPKKICVSVSWHVLPSSLGRLFGHVQKFLGFTVLQRESRTELFNDCSSLLWPQERETITRPKAMTWRARSG